MNESEKKKFIVYGGNPPSKDSMFAKLWQAQRDAEEWTKVRKWMDASKPSDTDPAFARFLQRTLTPVI
jgi:hypothetical protein